MNRRTFIGGLTTSLMGTGAITIALQTSDQRLEALEDRVTGLEDRVANLEDALGSTEESSETPETSGAEGQSENVTGVGTSVSEKFTLTQGRYRVDATLTLTSDFDGFIVYLHGPDGFEELLFNEIVEGGGTQELSTVVEIPRDGEFFLETSNTSSSWSIRFSVF